MSRDTYIKESLGDVYNHVRNARVLMVGAGGIGCELLKNLVLTGFGEVHMVDLDTIDLSNLNRQFLFGHEHIKKSKALVAKETAQKFNPNAKLVAYHANIKDSQFNIAWFKGFSLVFNALDNLDARRYVNKMCLAAEVPLIESGTTGFNGQVQVISKGRTECYDCNPKEVQKSFPVCTIRTTPSQPIHCIVWAKSYLFNQLFGVDEDESPELDNTVSAENAAEIENLRREVSELKRVKDAFGTPEFVKLIFEKVFEIDINRLLSMEEAWKHRRKPVPISYEEIKKQADEQHVDPTKVAANDQPIWSLAENFAVFVDSVERLSKRLSELQAGPEREEAVLSFDKDDDDTLDFVVAAANLRSHIFGIECKSKFDVKRNIIPAIATTNAIIAGVCVLQSFKVLNGDFDHAKVVFLSRQPERIFSTESLQPPNPECSVCSVARVPLQVDPAKLTLGGFVEEILKGKLGYTEELTVVTSSLLYDVEFDDNVDKTFADLGIIDGSFVTIIDDDEPDGLTPRVNLEFLINATTFSEPEQAFRIENIPEIPRKPAKLEDDSDVPEVPPASSGLKRKADEEERESVKRSRVGPSNDLILLDDDETIDID